MVNVEIDYDEKQALKLCNDIRKYIAESKEQPVSKVRRITVTNLENWGNPEEKWSELSAYKCLCTFYRQHFSIC